MVPVCHGVLQSSQEIQLRWACGVCKSSKFIVTKAFPLACRPTPSFSSHHCFLCGFRNGELLAYPGELLAYPGELLAYPGEPAVVTGAWIVPTLPDTILGSALAVPALVPPAMGQAVSLGSWGTIISAPRG